MDPNAVVDFVHLAGRTVQALVGELQQTQTKLAAYERQDSVRKAAADDFVDTAVQIGYWQPKVSQVNKQHLRKDPSAIFKAASALLLQLGQLQGEKTASVKSKLNGLGTPVQPSKVAKVGDPALKEFVDRMEEIRS